ncbi:MAG: IS4 family transposase [Massilia sp.]|jgi:hypothetical protein|nr:IS4 family transposase [Massilia sp.]
MLSNALPLAAELPMPPDWRLLVDHLPREWIEQALRNTRTASIRRRRLPAEQVVWLVIALALCRHRSIRQVVAELDIALPGSDDRFVTDSAVTQARERLGVEPMRWLFEAAAESWKGQDADRRKWRGLDLLAMDGTTLRLADSAAVRDHFGGGKYKGGAIASYPQARGVTLCMLETQLVLGAQFNTYKTSELAMAGELLPHLPDHSLTLLDRGFVSSDFLTAIANGGRERHYLIPAKCNAKWTLVDGDDNDGRVSLKRSAKARKGDPALSSHWEARAIKVAGPDGGKRYVLTSLLDRKKYPAAEIAKCYARRWGIETSFRELKDTMLGMALTLRSQSVEGVHQEILGALIAYNLVRVEMAKAALQAKCEPTRVSFVLALATIQYEMMSATADMAPGKLPSVLARMRERLATNLNVPRPGREKTPRVVKTPAQRYPFRKSNEAKKSDETA